MPRMKYVVVLVAQFVERSSALQSVVGSNPTQGSSSLRADLGTVEFFALLLPCALVVAHDT